MNVRSPDQTTCAAFWVKGIADTLEAAGLDIHALFKAVGLEQAALSDADARFPTEGSAACGNLLRRALATRQLA